MMIEVLDNGGDGGLYIDAVEVVDLSTQIEIAVFTRCNFLTLHENVRSETRTVRLVKRMYMP